MFYPDAMKSLRFVPLLFVLTAALYAQTTGAGTISGTLTDQSGAIVPGATVIVHNTNTGAERSLASNDAGAPPCIACCDHGPRASAVGRATSPSRSKM